MKNPRIWLAIGCLFIAFFVPDVSNPLHAQSMEITPLFVADENETFTVTLTPEAGDYNFIYFSDNCVSTCPGNEYAGSNTSITQDAATYGFSPALPLRFILVDTTASEWSAECNTDDYTTYDTCAASDAFISAAIVQIGSEEEIDFQDSVDNAAALFESTTGFTFASTVDFLKDLARLIMGSALYVIESLMPWVLALVAITVIVGLIWSAFRFFKH